MIIDDGYKGREHRNNIFNEDFKLIGIAKYNHEDLDNVISMEFAGGLVRGNEDHFKK